MERWELRAGVIAILGSANGSLTLQDLARGLGSDEQSVEKVLQEYEAILWRPIEGCKHSPRSQGAMGRCHQAGRSWVVAKTYLGSGN
jgi:hypothetical protein